MASGGVLCNKVCAVQNPDKSFTDGMLYVYRELARFVPKKNGSGPQQRLEIAIEDIGGQKKSKNNPMLMLETPTAKPVFRFTSMEDRDAVTAAIQQAQQAAMQPKEPAPAPKAAVAPSSAAAAATAAAAAAGNQSASQLAQQLTPEQRQGLLDRNMGLAAQYKALVVDSKALTDDEFWSSTAVQKVAGLAGKPTTTPRASKRGLANRLVDLARQHESAGDAHLARVNMTAEDEQQLLAEKPALRQLYDAQVGAIMTREEFWQRYFRYYMAKRMKRGGAMKRFKELQQNLMADSAAAVADLTGDAAQQEATDLEMSALFSTLEANSGLDAAARKALQRRLNPTVDLAAAAEDRLTADGYGLAHNTARSEVEQVQGYSALSQQLAQDYNIHAAAVIGQVPKAAPPAAAAAGPSQPAAAAAKAAAGAADGQLGNLTMSEMNEEELRQYKQQAGSGLQDLEAPLEQSFEELHVTNPRLYFSVMPQQSGAQAGPGQQQQQQQPGRPPDVVAALRRLDPAALTETPIKADVAYKVLGELCGGEAGHAAREGGNAPLGADMLTTMQRHTMLVDELLRHFWSQIPVNTAEKEAKIQRIQVSLEQAREALNRTVKPGQGSTHSTMSGPLLRLAQPLFAQLDVADTAYKQVNKALQAKQRARTRPQK